MLLALLRACPEAASVSNNRGELPLHSGMGHLSARVAKAFVEVYPEAVVIKAGDFGRTPLHALIRERLHFSLDVAKVLVAAHPDALMVKDDADDNIPLSIAVQRRADLPTVEWLINAWPESVKVTNVAGEIPLHIAAEGAPVELVRVLYQAWPGSVKQTDSHGVLALAVAVDGGSQATVDFLLEAYPEATRIQDNDGWLPLHHAAVRRPDVVQSLLAVYPGAARIKDNGGRLPLHRAAGRKWLGVVTVLVDAWSDGLKERDNHGRIPLFHAFEGRKLNEGVAKLLLEACPDAVKCTNDAGDLLIHKVSRSDDDSDATEARDLSETLTKAKYLIDTWPRSLLQRNRDGDTPLHILLSCITDKETLGRKRKRDEVVNDKRRGGGRRRKHSSHYSKSERQRFVGCG